MPLSFGLRDEDNERINNILKILRELVFVPNALKIKDIDDYLAQLELSLAQLQQPETDVAPLLKEKGLDWENMELFADILAKAGQHEGLEALKAKALKVYHYIQAESKVFSFEIMNKINALK